MAYRNYASLAAPDVPAPDELKLAPELDLPACSNPAMASMVQAFKPCTPIASVSQRTIAASDASGATVNRVTLNVRATIYPGLSGLQDMDAGCQYTHLFALASTLADFYLIAQDVGATGTALDTACAATDAALDSGSGVWTKDCGYAHYASLLLMPRILGWIACAVAGPAGCARNSVLATVALDMQAANHWCAGSAKHSGCQHGDATASASG